MLFKVHPSERASWITVNNVPVVTRSTTTLLYFEDSQSPVLFTRLVCLLRNHKRDLC